MAGLGTLGEHISAHEYPLQRPATLPLYSRASLKWAALLLLISFRHFAISTAVFLTTVDSVIAKISLTFSAFYHYELWRKWSEYGYGISYGYGPPAGRTKGTMDSMGSVIATTSTRSDDGGSLSRPPDTFPTVVTDGLVS